MKEWVGYYFAGLTDGEGHFAITRRKRGWSCQFTIKLRADDLPLLEWLQEETGLGAIYRNRAIVTPTRNNNPAFQWHIATKRECVGLVDIFADYPLRSRKAEEFRVWARAAEYWYAPDYIDGVNARGHREPLLNWTPMEEAAIALRELRVYRDPIELREAVAP